MRVAGMTAITARRLLGWWLDGKAVTCQPFDSVVHPCLEAANVLGALRGEDCEDLGSAVVINVREK